MADLKLQALDEDDLAVVSAQCQDAIVRVGDLSFAARDQRFALVCNRFDWMAANGAPDRTMRTKSYQRRRSGLRFERVASAQSTGFDASASDAVLVLLAITFVPSQAPAGTLHLQFAAGAEVRLDVECIEAELRDLGAAWETTLRPDHETS